MTEILRYLGLPSDNQKLRTYLETIGIKLSTDLAQEVDEDDGSYYDRTYLEYLERGYCLVFTDEASFVQGKGDQVTGLGKLYFSTIFYYAQGIEEYEQYKGKLPYRLSFDLDKLEIRSILGDSSWQRFNPDKTIAMDRWDSLPNVPYRLSLNYGKEAKRIRTISMTVTDAQFTQEELKILQQNVPPI